MLLSDKKIVIKLFMLWNINISFKNIYNWTGYNADTNTYYNS